MSVFRPCLALGLICVILAACTLGPDYKKPDDLAAAKPGTPLYRARQMTMATPPQRWWEQLHDPVLTQLEAMALADSPNLKALGSRVQAARQLVLQRHANQLPRIGADASAAKFGKNEIIEDRVDDYRDRVTDSTYSFLGHNRIGDTVANNIRDRVNHRDRLREVYRAGFDASWDTDMFGRLSRATEEAKANAEASIAELADAQVQLAAEIGEVYLNYRGAQQRLALNQENLDAARQSVDLVRQRFGRGMATDLDVQRALAQQHQQELSIPHIQGQLQEARDQLALMVGREPGALDTLLKDVKPLPKMPDEIKVDDAAAVLQRRPDVRQAERELAASSARIGQAIALKFPHISLLGSLNMTVANPGDFTSNAASYLVAPMLQWSVFDFGRNKALVGQAKAAYQANLARYQSKVLSALQDANSALIRFGTARSQLVMAKRTQATTHRSHELMEQRRKAGLTTLIDVLDVQRQRLQSDDAEVQAQTQLLVNFVALQKSLGLGWQLPQPEVADNGQPAEKDSKVQVKKAL